MGELPWRVGRKVGRTLYDAHGTLIGTMDTRLLASLVVAAVNGVPMSGSSGHATCERQFAVRCADAQQPVEAPWTALEDADRSVRLWDADCDCGGPHSVLVRWRHEALTDWEPWEDLDG